MTGEQLPAGSGFAAVPQRQQVSELRRAGERERAEIKAQAERARHAMAERRRIPLGARPAGRQRPGERELRRFSVASMSKAVARNSPSAAGLLAALRPVPASHARFRSLDGAAEVSCTCCELVTVLVNQSALCECGRVFWNLGEQVRVVKTEQHEEDRDG